MYKPDTAVLGTVQEADTAQLPQSMSPVGRAVVPARGLGLRERGGRQHAFETTLRAPLPWYQPMRRMSMWYDSPVC